MNENQLREVAKIIKSHKLNGAVKVKLLQYKFVGQPMPEFLYINTEKNPLPYFVAHFDHNTDRECIVEFEDWNSKEEVSQQLRGKSIYIDVLEPTHQGFQLLEDANLKSYAGYQLFNQHKQAIGKIEEVYDIPNNTLLSVNINEQEVLIPIHDDLLIEVRNKQQEVYLYIPEGLINLDAAISEEE